MLNIFALLVILAVCGAATAVPFFYPAHPFWCFFAGAVAGFLVMLVIAIVLSVAVLIEGARR